MTTYTGSEVDSIVTALAVYDHDTDVEKQLLRAQYAGHFARCYDPYWKLVDVPADRVDRYIAKTGCRQPSDRPTAVLTGTSQPASLESEIVTGSETIIITLTKGTWAASGTDFNAIRQGILDGLVSAQAEAAGWNVKRALFAVTTVVRTSATVVTVTTPATASYSVTADETITVTIPANSVVADGTTYPIAIVATPTITITANS